MNNNRWLQALIILLVFIAATWLAGQLWALIIQFANIILLFFLAWLLAFALSPLARRLQRAGLPQGLAVVLVYLGVLLVFILIGVLVFPLLADQIQSLIAATPAYTAELERLGNQSLDQLDKWGVRVEDIQLNSLYGTIGEQVRNVGGSMLNFVSGLTSFLFNAVIILLLSFYFMKDGDRLFRSLIVLLPRSLAAEVQLLGDSVARAFGGYLRGQLVFAALYGVLNAAVMAVFKLDYVLVASIVAGFAMLIPMIGNFLAYMPPVLIILVSGNANNWLGLLIGLVVVQGLMMQLVGPRIMSKAIGMHPLFVVFALLAGLQIAGTWGALFGIPIAGVVQQVAGPYFARLRDFFNAPDPGQPALALQGTVPVPTVILPTPVEPLPAPGAAAPAVGAIAAPNSLLILARGLSRRLGAARRRVRP